MWRTVACLALLSAPLAVVAQSAPRPPQVVDPAFALSRADEIWPAAPASAAAARTLKHIALRADDAAWLTLAGAVRGRASSFSNFNFSPAVANQDAYAEIRSIVSADLWVGRANGRHARFFVEVRDANGVGRTLPGGIRTNERDRTDWQSAFAEVGAAKGHVRVGRQELVLGRERLVGIGDWGNSRRAFEGAKGLLRWRNVRGELFDGRVVAVRSTRADRPDSTTQFRYAAASSVKDRPAARSAMPSLWQVWVMRLQSDRGASSRTTLGGRAVWRAPVRRALMAIEVEAAQQRGHLKAKAVDAWFAVAEGTVTWRAVRWSPSALLGIDVASGTGADSARAFNAFQPPYATAHGFNGIADVLGRGNLAEARLGGTVDPFRAVQVQGLWRQYWRVRLEDGVYTKANALFSAPAGSRERAVMHEADVIVNWQWTRYLKLQGGGALVLPGPFLKGSIAGAEAERFLYLSTTVTF